MKKWIVISLLIVLFAGCGPIQVPGHIIYAHNSTGWYAKEIIVDYSGFLNTETVEMTVEALNRTVKLGD